MPTIYLYTDGFFFLKPRMNIMSADVIPPFTFKISLPTWPKQDVTADDWRSCKQGIEPSGDITGAEFFEQA